MASMVRLFSKADGIVEEVYNRRNQAEETRALEYVCAVKLQSWFRAARVQVYIRFLHSCAVQIQSVWRGYMGRSYSREMIKTQVFIMKLNYYNANATKIQKVWRGYYTRKYVFNYYSRKRYLSALQIKNEIVRSELKEYAEQQEHLRHRQADAEEKRKGEDRARKTHYLLSTQVRPGVYNSPYKPFPSHMEYLLHSVKPRTPENKEERENLYDPAWSKYNTMKPTHLPPLAEKPQGPFRNPKVVQLQRYKPLQPSLKVATSFTCLENARKSMKDHEYVTRLNDNIFEPFSTLDHRYSPLLYTTSKYGNLPYGAKYFREERIYKNSALKPFKTVVPPIPMFDTLNNTYSQGQV